MVNLKFAAGGAVVGLVISFFSGLFGGVSIGIILIRALVCAVVGGAIGAGVSFVFVRFLADSAAEEAPVRTVSTGSVVDISVNDEPLPDTDAAPDFFIHQKAGNSGAPEGAFVQKEQTETVPKQPSAFSVKTSEPFAAENSGVPKTQAPVGQEKTGSAKEAGTNQFVPVSIAKEKVAAAGTGAAASGANEPKEELDTLDLLPDVSDLTSSNPKSAFEGVISDSSFATEGLKPSGSSAASDIDVGTDTSLMAEAIRTILTNEG